MVDYICAVMKQNIIVAIDGYSSCGKSTLAKGLANALDYIYIDSGAMYRAVTLYFLRHQVDWTQAEQVTEALNSIKITFDRSDGKPHTLLNGEHVEREIRQMEISQHVSPVSAIPAVRRSLVQQQQQLGEGKGIVMDGRDIGTVVFPAAELKVFLTADGEERARRRFAELQAKGYPSSMEEVQQNLQHRDHIDSTREDSPLRQAADAVVIDNTNLTEDEQLQMVLALGPTARGLSA